MAELMARLEYNKYIVHGSDAGQAVGECMSLNDAQHVAGLHVNLGGVKLAADNKHNPPTTEREASAIARLEDYLGDKSGYSHLQSTRPDTLSYALTDSPVGQLAWIAAFTTLR